MVFSACGVSVMQFALGALLPILVEQYSVKGCFIVIAGIIFNIVAASALYRPTIIESEVEKLEEENENTENNEESQSGVDFSFFCHPAFLLFFFSQGIFFAG